MPAKAKVISRRDPIACLSFIFDGPFLLTIGDKLQSAPPARRIRDRANSVASRTRAPRSRSGSVMPPISALATAKDATTFRGGAILRSLNISNSARSRVILDFSSCQGSGKANHKLLRSVT